MSARPWRIDYRDADGKDHYHASYAMLEAARRKLWVDLDYGGD